jgi:hypothetical protein
MGAEQCKKYGIVLTGCPLHCMQKQPKAVKRDTTQCPNQRVLSWLVAGLGCGDKQPGEHKGDLLQVCKKP